MGQPVENAVIGAGTRTGTRLRFATPQGWLPPLDWCDNYGVAVMGDYICINWPIFFALAQTQKSTKMQGAKRTSLQQSVG